MFQSGPGDISTWICTFARHLLQAALLHSAPAVWMDAIRDNTRRIFGKYRARCAPVMDTARSTLYSVPRIKLCTASTLHTPGAAGLFCMCPPSTVNGVILRFPNFGHKLLLRELHYKGSLLSWTSTRVLLH